MLILAVFFVRGVFLDDSVEVISSEDAVDRYRDTTESSLPPIPASLPLPGVYRYRTEGTESIDAVGGATHEYPAETTITVTPAGCGVTLQWDALRERNERWQLCVDGDDIALQPTGGSYHEFFGRQQVEDLACDRSVVVVPADGLPRPPVTLACELGGRPTVPVWEVLDRSTRIVDGRSVEVQHVRMTVTDEDRWFEYIAMDWWLDEHGLPVEVRLDESSLADTAFGDVRYDERYLLDLVSLAPLT